MSTARQYCEKLDTETLETLLRDFCDGTGNLHADVALLICDILARRNPPKPDVYAAFRQLCRHYLPKK